MRLKVLEMFADKPGREAVGFPFGLKLCQQAFFDVERRSRPDRAA